VIDVKYERPIVLATYKVDELMQDAAVCTRYGNDCPEKLPLRRLFGRG
jgi:hypothetical protein